MLKYSPLDAEHRALDARMTPFGGWDMPLQYAGGTLSEHLACRQDAVVFDVSHLGTVRVEGAHAFDILQKSLTNDLNKIAPGRAQYTHLLDPTNASVLDDIIVWWIADQVFDVMPNASNTDDVIAAIGGVDTTAIRAVLAVQGPNAREKVATFFPEAAAVGKFMVAQCTWNGVICTVAGTGYTGEQGIEIAIENSHAAALWKALLEAGVQPSGLGARDTLRLEAGLPLHGHELGHGITTLQANLEWVVSWTKGEFIGRSTLEHEKQTGVSRVLRGIATEGRRPPRAECNVVANGKVIGVVTSGNYSPILEHGIALALVEPSYNVGDIIAIDVRGSELPGRIVELPFVAKK
jgi:aminomethyltransferase